MFIVKRRSSLLCALLLFLVFSLCSPGLAAGEQFSLSPPVEISSNLHSSIVVNIHSDTSTEGVSLIKKWVCGISDNENGTVTIMGQTDTYNKVEYLDAKIYLQYWTGSKWEDVTSRTYSSNNSYYTSGSSYISVEAGYYRVRGVHNAQNSGNYDSQSSVSDAIWVQ